MDIMTTLRLVCVMMVALGTALIVTACASRDAYWSNLATATGQQIDKSTDKKKVD